MNKYVLCVLGAIIGAAFLVSCQQQGTTGTTTTASAMAKPSPTPSRTRHYKTTAGSAHRNPPKTEGSATEMPSPSPGESPAPTP